MKRRPWPITILAIFHLAYALFFITFTSGLGKWSPLLITQMFFLFPLAGLSIYLVKRWSYFLFVICWIAILYINYLKWLEEPYFLILVFIIFKSILGLVTVTYFLIPNVRAVYFNPRFRWWENAPRFRYEIPCKINKIDGLVLDISRGGAFVFCSDKVGLENVSELELNLEGRKTIIRGRVVHHGVGRKNCMGIQFVGKNAHLNTFLNKLNKTGMKNSRSDEGWRNSLKSWCYTLFKTGKGLVPDFPLDKKKKD